MFVIFEKGIFSQQDFLFPMYDILNKKLFLEGSKDLILVKVPLTADFERYLKFVNKFQVIYIVPIFRIRAIYGVR